MARKPKKNKRQPDPQAAYETALHSIRQAQRDNTRQLDLSGLGLTSLPPEIGQLTALQTLYLFNNQLSSLPSEFAQLTALQELFLYNNRLSDMPPEIAQLTALQWLDFGSNKLSSLPPEITQLTALLTLDLDNNQLSSLPPEIAQLTALRILHLRNNRLSSLPPEIAKLTALQRLDLINNRLSSLPRELGQLRTMEEAPPPFNPPMKGLWLDGNPLPDPYSRLIAGGQPGATTNVLAWLRGELDPDEIKQTPELPADAGSGAEEAEEEDELAEAVTQRPAAFRFGLRNGKIDTLPERANFTDRAAANDLYSELKAKAQSLRDRLAQSNSDQRVQGSVNRLLDALGERLADVRPGVLLSRSRSIEADRNAFNTPKARRELFPDAIAMMDDVLLSLEDLLAAFPYIREIEAEQIALHLQRDPKVIKGIQRETDSIKLAAADSGAATGNAVKALHEHDADIAEARNNTVRARLLADHLLVVRNFIGETLHGAREAMRPAAQTVGQGLATVGNELKDVGKESWKEIKKEIPKAAGMLPRAALFILLASVVHPTAGLAVFAKSFSHLAKAAKKLARRGAAPKARKKKRVKAKPKARTTAKAKPAPPAQ